MSKEFPLENVGAYLTCDCCKKRSLYRFDEDYDTYMDSDSDFDSSWIIKFFDWPCHTEGCEGTVELKEYYGLQERVDLTDDTANVEVE